MTAATVQPSGHRIALLLGGAVLAVWTGFMALALNHAALPPESDGMVLAVFPPGTPETAGFAALVRAGGEPVRQTWLGFAWIARGEGEGFVGRLHREGALAAYGSILRSPRRGGPGRRNSPSPWTHTRAARPPRADTPTAPR